MNDQRKTKKALSQESNVLEYSEGIINTVREPLIVLDKDFRVVTASRSFYEYFKVNPKQTEGQLIYDIGNRQWNIPELRKLLEDILPHKTSFDNYEVEHDFTTIGKRVMLLNARQIKRVSGKEQIILLAIEDITGRKEMEKKLRNEEQRFRALTENSLDIILIMNREGIVTYINPAVEKALGFKPEERIGTNGLERIHPDDLRQATDAFITLVTDTNSPVQHGETRLRHRDGSWRTFETVGTNLVDDNIVEAVIVHHRDITERKQMEESLQKSERNFHLSLDNSPLGVRIVTAEGETLYANRAIVDIYGCDSIEELRGAPLKDLYTPESYAEFRIRKGKRERGEFCPPEYEISIVRKNGELRQVYAFRKEIIWNGARQFQVIYKDITDRKRAEETLKKSERQYRLLADNIHDVIFVMDMNLNYSYLSPSVKLLRGYEPEEAMKQTPAQTVTPSSLNLALGILSEVMELEKSEHRDIYVSRTFQVEMSRKDGTTVWTEVKASLIRDENQRAIGIMGVTRDITDRKQSEDELQKTLGRLRKSIDTTIGVLVSAVESRDPYTAGHQLRVADLARAIATEMGLPQDKIDGIRMAGSIHDIGKLSIPVEILSKPTKLTDIEFTLIKGHSKIGYEMLKDVESPWPLAQIVYQHHERMNGTGYPRNLKGDEILMEARIMTVADVVEAIASHRPYRAALGVEIALEEIEKNKGVFYDATVADACLRLFREKGYQFT
ncbi:MAG: PAS domain S-box protein [Smithella sp.]